MMEYNINKPWLTLDKWQQDYISEVKNDCWILKGRQVGGSTAGGIKVIEIAKAEETQLTGKGEYQISGFTEEQGGHIFEKALAYCQARYPQLIDMRAGFKPTNHDFYLKNGSHIFLKALGLLGAGARGKTPKRIWVDEAPLCMDNVFVALIPSMSVSGGKIDLIGTPNGKEGFFFRCSDEPELGDKIMKNFKRWKISAEDCPRHPKEKLEEAKAMMTDKEYATEFLAVFLDDMQRLFPDNLIKSRATLDHELNVPHGKYYLGVDIARLGKDLTSFQVIRKDDKEHYVHVYSETAKKKLTTWTENRILELNQIFNFRKIAIDAGSGSLGVGIYDHLINDPKVCDKIVAINSREIVSRINVDKHKFKMQNEEGYLNLLWGMQKGYLKLLKDSEVCLSLSSVLWEVVVSEGKLSKTHIYGKYTHTAEALYRAFWEAVHDNSLRLYATS